MSDLEKLTEKTLGGLKVKPVEDSVEYINVLVYGDPGVGKTVFSGTASLVKEMSPVLCIDIEGGLLSVAAQGYDVDVVRVKTWQQMQDVYDELRRGSDYKTVVLDSLTEIQKFSMNQIMEQVLKADPSRDPDVPGMREWGKNIEQIRRMTRAFRDLQMNTIITALAKSDKDPRTGLIKTKPSLSGKLADEVAGFFDEVFYMYTKVIDGEIKRLLLTTKTDTQEAKDRSGRMPAIVDNPQMPVIYDYMFNNKEN